MVILAIVLFVILGLYVVVGSILKKKLLINKSVLVLGIIAIALFMLGNTFGKSQETDNPYYHDEAPPRQYAPRVAQTDTRVYYVATFKENADTITLTDFYFYDKIWQHSDIPLPFKKENIRIYDRR